MMLSLTEFLLQIPKVEIHCHLFGTIRKKTLFDLNAKAGSPLAADELDDYYIRGDKPKGVLHIFRTLDDKLIRSPDDLYRITSEYLEDAHSHTVRYTEFFWNPTGTADKSGIPFPAAQAAIVNAMEDAENKSSIISRLLPSIDRQASPEKATKMVRWMAAHRHEKVIGIGMDYRENDGPPESFVEAYSLAKAEGYKTTAHAGEFGMPWTNVEISLDQLGIDRIDHGYTILENQELTERCARAGTIFTVVPGNSYYLRTLSKERWALDHPVRHMSRAGLRIHPNSDDPAFHHVTPTEAWQMMVDDFGYNLDHLRQFMINGLDGAWMPDQLREQWKHDWPIEYDTLRKRLDQEPVAAPDQDHIAS